MKSRITIAVITCIILIGNVVFAEDINVLDSQLIEDKLSTEENSDGEEEEYDITLTQNYNYGEQKVTLEWSGITDDKTLAGQAQIGDYVDYPITLDEINSNYEQMSSKIKNKTNMNLNNTSWRVIYNDGEVVKLVSTNPVCSTSIGGEDYNWRNANPYSYGDSSGDSGGYGVYYQLDQIAKCFENYSYVSNARALDIADLPHSSGLLNLREFLNQTESENISVEMREKGYEEIYDTDKHGDILGIGGSRIYDRKVATITDTTGLYTGGTFLLPNYYNGTDFLRALYYVDGTDVNLRRVYKKGKTITAGIKVVITLKAGIYQTTGSGTESDPWKISTEPGHGMYTLYQKSEVGEYEAKITTRTPTATLNASDGIRDISAPDKPNAELSLIRGDGWNLNLAANAGDNGTNYIHKVIAKAGQKEYTSNESTTTITTGVQGFSYVIDNNEYTEPGNQIMFKAGETITIPRVKINAGYILHLKAIDYAGNVSEVLHMPLKFVFRDLNLFKTYQEASNFTDTGIAQTPGWNHVNIDWNPIEIAKDEPEELPEVAIVIDTSGSMSGSGISVVKSGMNTLINKLLDYYPDMKISIITFNSGASVRISSSNNRAQLLSAISGMRASGGTRADKGINLGIDILNSSTQKNHVLITMTDGWSGGDPYSAIARAKGNGMKTISLIIDYGSTSQFSNSDSLYKVSSSNSSLYETIAYSLYQEIQDTMIAKYYPYREQEGEQGFSLVTKDALTDVEYPDKEASDKAGPSRPLVTLSETADRNGNIKMDLWAEDRGTSYEFYVKFVHPRTKDELYSNPVVQEIKTGIKGYAWTISDSPTTDPGSTIRNVQTVFGQEYVGKWLHIRAIDYAGNLGEVCHIKLETSRFIPWEELNERKELFCVQYGQTIPAREEENHLNAMVVAGSGVYALKEVVADPKTGDRIGTRFVEGTTTNIYGTQDIYSYSLGKYVVSQAETPLTRPGKEGNATEKEAYILNYYALNDSLDSAIQKAMYTTEISKGNVTWNWETTKESEALVAEANAYAAYKRKGYEFSNIKLDTAVYMDDDYKDTIIGPFILKYEPQGLKYGDKELYFCNIVGMKVYDQNNNVIAELDKNGNNIGNIQVEFIYTGTATATKRYEPLFTKEKYKYPVGYEEFYIKLTYKEELDSVTQINKIDFIHNEYNVDAQYNVLVGTYNKVKWTPNRISRSDKDILWCHDIDNGYNICMHDKTYSHIVGCYFYLTATVYNSYREIPSQKLIDVIWTKNEYKESVQTLTPGSGETDPEYPASDEKTNKEWRLVMDFTGNIWHDGMEDQNNGIKESVEHGIEKVRVDIYQVDKNGNRTGIGYYAHSDSLGNYTLKDVKKGIYELEFVYDGQTYKTTKLLVNGTVADYKADLTRQKYINNSTSEERDADRKEFNEAYTEIAGNSTAIGGRGQIELSYETGINTSSIQTTDDGYTKSNFEMYAKTVSNNIHYPISKRITVEDKKYIKIVDSENVNLGLAERYKTDTSLKTDLYETIFSIKGNTQSYIFSERNIRDINSNIEKEQYIQEINRADYNWTLEELLSKAPDEETKARLIEILGSKEQSELEAYLDYIIVIRNAGEKDYVQIAELADYYSKDLEYATQYRDFDITSWAQVKYDEVNEGEEQAKTNKIEIQWTTKSKYENSSNSYASEYNKIYTTGLDREDLRFKKGEYLEVHIILKVKKDNNSKVELDETGVGKSSMTEVNGYKTYYIQDGSIAGLIDADSQPGNANPTKERAAYEDDEDKSPTLLLRLADSATTDDSLDNEDGINIDENGNIVGYGNVIEGNIWEDSKVGEHIQKLINNQIIGDGIRQDEETLIQNIQVELIEYFKHPTDSSKDVYLTLKTQNTRTVLSLSNGAKLEGGYSFINLASGTYKTKFTYGLAEQLKQNTKYNGQDYQGMSTADINANEETTKSYEDVEIMLVADVSGSMAGTSSEQIKDLATKMANGIYDKLPEVKIGITKFNNTAEVISKPEQNRNTIIKAIAGIGSENETAIGYGIEAATNSYSADAKEKIMIVFTDSKETVQNIEQVIKKIEIATDDNNIELTTILTTNEEEIFGTQEAPRRGNVYTIYNVQSEEVIDQICTKIVEDSQLESRRSSAKDIEGNTETKGTRAYSINKYQVMTLEKAQKIDVESIEKLEGAEKEEAIEILADETYMTAESKMATFEANNVKVSKIHELNLALMERPKTKLVIETQIKAIKIILSDDTELINTRKGISKNVNGMDQEEVPITIYMDEEIMHGSTLIVEYEVTVRNEGEIDRLSNYLTGASDDTVTTRAKLVFNYASKNMLYRDENSVWDNVEISDIQGKVTGETINVLKDKDMKVYETEGFGIELYPAGSFEVENKTGDSEAVFTVTLSKLITSQNDEADLTFDSSMEIVERENTAGRRSETEVPGNYVADTIPLEVDAIKNRKIIITKPWGENRSMTYILYTVAACTVIAIFVGGTVYIKKKPKDK